MRQLIILTIIISTFTNFSIAQIRATTESGNKVLLFDDGTWKYDEKNAFTNEKVIVGSAVITAATLNIDSTREISTEPHDLFYLPSQRMERYFGESAGNIRCKLSCSNNLGTVKLHFIWEFPVSDGNRYFGWFKQGTKVTFKMVDDEEIELIMGNENSFKRFEKNNYSVFFNASEPLTKEQIATFSSKKIDKIEVDWKKKPEEYDLEGSRFLMDALPEVF